MSKLKVEDEQLLLGRKAVKRVLLPPELVIVVENEILIKLQ